MCSQARRASLAFEGRRSSPRARAAAVAHTGALRRAASVLVPGRHAPQRGAVTEGGCPGSRGAARPPRCRERGGARLAAPVADGRRVVRARGVLLRVECAQVQVLVALHAPNARLRSRPPPSQAPGSRGAGAGLAPLLEQRSARRGGARRCRGRRSSCRTRWWRGDSGAQDMILRMPTGQSQTRMRVRSQAHAAACGRA